MNYTSHNAITRTLKTIFIVSDKLLIKQLSFFAIKILNIIAICKLVTG